MGLVPGERPGAEEPGADGDPRPAAAVPVLPEFAYHPDPLATGAIERRAVTCAVCRRPRGHAYAHLPCAEEELTPEETPICPWCVADGSAARELECTFVDGRLTDGRRRVAVPDAALDELVHRTPGFAAWSDGGWRAHCGLPCAYLGRFDAARLAERGDRVRAQVTAHLGRSVTAALRLDGTGPCAHLFRCLRCGTHLPFHEYPG